MCVVGVVSALAPKSQNVNSSSHEWSACLRMHAHTTSRSATVVVGQSGSMAALRICQLTSASASQIAGRHNRLLVFGAPWLYIVVIAFLQEEELL